jgi:predicted ATP-grasp superfamily ATP-dependent carboligase
MRALKPFSKKIILTMPVWGPRSRLATRKYRVPAVHADWQAGRISAENTPQEEKYICVLLDICRREAIDVIFPSYDPQVYVLSKNLHRFQRSGVVIPVVDFATLLKALDKYRTLKAAEAAGFPRPETCLPENDGDLQAFGERVAPPWVIRPRFTAGSKGMTVVTEKAALLRGVENTRSAFGTPMVQEYIPGGRKQNFHVVFDRNQNPVSACCPRSVRHSYRVYRNSTAACIFKDNHPFLPKVVSLAKELGWYGPMTLQTKIDSRDGLPKLMEINPRLGSALWYRTEMGMNHPRMCIDLARNRPIEVTAQSFPETMLLNPIDDFFSFGYDILDALVYQVRRAGGLAAPIDPENGPVALNSLIRRYLDDYRSRYPKKYHPHFRYAAQDPVVFLWRVYNTFRYAAGRMRYLGV